MAKKLRPAVPKATKEKVLKEYSHKCSVCGTSDPHLHHIDEDPSNNDPLNLLPLCPNHHLSEQHSPARRHDPRKLRLFREHKNILILNPQFQALFSRMGFMYEPHEAASRSEISDKITNLSQFIAEFNMGQYYAKKVAQCLRPPGSSISGDNSEEFKRRLKIWEEEQRIAAIFQVAQGAKDVEKLVVEMLDFQEWKPVT